MRRLLLFLPTILMFTVLAQQQNPADVQAEKQDTGNDDDKDAIIIEVEGDPSEHEEYMELHYPSVEVVATYHTLFKGLALRGDPKQMDKLDSLEFVKSIHPVTTYKANSEDLAPQEEKSDTMNGVLPGDLNDSPYTGEGVKVGIIDTGIDYTHPDLKMNYQEGYDLVDLDNDPMETPASEGMPTFHGTHVAGIIAANGDLQGVAPDADIYAYRALGPGGQGTSVQVIAALEQAVRDDVDMVNLSLGNTVNGPDYPTSVAVNRAVEQGVAVVVASGNAGPDDWTVGAPATASRALSVGSLSLPEDIPSLYEPIHDKHLNILPMQGSPPWDLQKDYPVEVMDKETDNMQGKIALIQRGKIPFYEKAKAAEEAGAEAIVISNNEKGMFQGSLMNEQDPVSVPVAAVTQKTGKWLRNHRQKQSLYLQTAYNETDEQVSEFSSRGPVTLDWDIKPDVIAPGANIVSTVPGGYQKLQGTSMAAPHVTGALAVLKEAHPDWSIEKLESALKTTASPVENDDKIADPIEQGMGEVSPNSAAKTDTIIRNSLLSYGKVNDHKEDKKQKIVIENTSDEDRSYSFHVPKKKKGLQFDLPQTFSVKANEKKTVQVGLSVHGGQLEEGVHQGFLTLNEGNEKYRLPYLFINQSADYPKAMGFDLELKPLSDDRYKYQIYVTDDAKRVEVQLFDDASLLYKRPILTIEDPATGMNEGEMTKKEIGEPGIYKAMITVELEDGSYKNYETELEISEEL